MKKKKIPIGISNFKDIVTGNYVYIKKLAIVFNGKDVYVKENGVIDKPGN